MSPSMSHRHLHGAMLAALATLGPAAVAQSRGELLYTTHCVACHTTQMHWRDQRLAQDWNSLQALVRRWQGTALLQWSEDDILEVTRFLNERIYRFVPPAQSVGSSGTLPPERFAGAQPP